MEYILGAAFVVAIVISIIVIKNAITDGQFDEDIKYLVFDEKDKDKMTPEEFEKAMRVNKEQEEKRTEALRLEKEEKMKKTG